MKRFALTLLITLGTAFALFPFFFVLLPWGGDSEGTGGFFRLDDNDVLHPVYKPIPSMDCTARIGIVCCAALAMV